MTAGQRSVVLVGLPQEGERVPRVDPFGDQVVANAEPHDAGNFDLLVFVLRLEAVPNSLTATSVKYNGSDKATI